MRYLPASLAVLAAAFLGSALHGAALAAAGGLPSTPCWALMTFAVAAFDGPLR